MNNQGITVNTLLSHMDDDQRIAIFDLDTYAVDDSIFHGMAQDLPLKYYTRRVSYFYSDYAYSKHFSGSFIGVRLAE